LSVLKTFIANAPIMSRPIKKNSADVGALHPRNPHAGRYDFAALCKSYPDMQGHLQPNPMGDQTIDFGDAQSVLCRPRKFFSVKVADDFF